MNTYLQLQCGDYPLLMPVGTVIEIGTNDATRDQSARRPWRDRSLQVIDLPALLGCVAGARSGQVVIGCDGDAQAIAVVDAVLGIREFSDADIVDVGDVSTALGTLVAGVCVDEQGNCLLCLREPFAWLANDHAAGGRLP